MRTLRYHRKALADILEEDSLFVMAKGLGLTKILGMFLSMYSLPKFLVVIVSSDEKFLDSLQDELSSLSCELPIRKVTSEKSAEERARLYNQGGVIAVTHRILVVDLLNEKLDAAKVTGMVVPDAHRVLDTTNESFLLRIYRQRNKKGFIKGFSESPETFQVGFSRAEKVMRCLYVRKLHLWPRFQSDVSEELAKHAPEVIELHEPMSETMTKMQNAAVEVMNECLKLLARTAKIDVTDISPDSALFKSFDFQVRRQLDPIWHTISQNTKNLAAELTTIRKILTYVARLDCVTYYQVLEDIRSVGQIMAQRSDWLMSGSACVLFETAKNRVFNISSETPAAAKKKTGAKGKAAEMKLNSVLEPNPKWALLDQVLAEIAEDAATDGVAVSPVVIFVKDERTASQIRDILTYGSEAFLKYQFRRFCLKKLDAQGRATGGGGAASSSSATSSATSAASGTHSLLRAETQLLLDHARTLSGSSGDKRKNSPTSATVQSSKKKKRGTSSGTHGVDEDAPGENLRETLFVASEDLEKQIELRPMHEEDQGDEEMAEDDLLIGREGMVCIHTSEFAGRLLEELRPQNAIMYDPDLSLTRALETYRAGSPDEKLRVYFLVYENSVEEKKYLQALKREREAFEILIDNKANMVIPADQDGLSDEIGSSGTVAALTSTRNAGGKSGGGSGRKRRVVVDVREFRSSLPPLLHARDLELCPETLTVGDYVLSPDIVVERKSIPDLFGSFASGRLYNQCASMTRHYRVAVLLIEFDETKSFSLLQSASSVSSDISPSSITSKVVLLTIHFPSLRIIWSRSARSTAHIFDEIKQLHMEPVPETAVSIGIGEEENSIGDLNLTACEMLKKLPGITSRNWRDVVDKVECIADLASMTQEQISAIIGAENARLLYTFLHQKV